MRNTILFPNRALIALLLVLLFALGLPPATVCAQDDPDEPEEPEEPSWIVISGEDGLMEGEFGHAFDQELKKRRDFNSYQRRLISITVWRGISPWGTNSENVINHIVLGLSKDEMARLEGIGVATLSSLAYEHVYGFQYGTFAAVAGENLVGMQLSLAGSVAGENSYGAQVGGLGAVAGRDAYLLQIAGAGAVAGRDLVGGQLGGLAAVAGRDISGIQISGLAAVTGSRVLGGQASGLAAIAGDDMLGLQISGMATIAGRDMSGVQFGGIAAIAGGDVRLLQIGGIAAIAGRSMQGVQVGGIATVAAKDSWGLNLSGIAAVVDGDFIGVQGSGLANVVTDRLYGLQVGTINFASDQRSMQVGVVNAAEVLRGIQIGFSNGVFDNHGLMIGLLNSIEGDVDGIHIGPITQITGEPRGLNLYYEASGTANLDYVTGTRALRSIFSLAFANWQDPSLWMIGGGMGRQFAIVPDHWDFELDLLGYKINENEFWTDQHSYLTRLRGAFLVKFSPSNSIYFGASYNNLTSKVNDGSDLEVIALSSNSDGDWFHRSWIGYEVGLQITYDRIDLWNLIY